MTNIINSRSLGLVNSLEKRLQIDSEFEPILIITTPFSLPFSKWVDRQDERTLWLHDRYRLFTESLKRCIKQQKHLNFTCIWLIFLSKGDRKILNLPPSECFENGIKLLYIEVDTKAGYTDDDYRSTSIPQSIIKVIRLNMHKSISEKMPIISLRVDSDDLISPNYLYLMAYCCNRAYSLSINDCFMAFEHGLLFNLNNRMLVPRIWPEPAFLARYELANVDSLRTVWQFSHDSIPLSTDLFHVTTSMPQWCATIGIKNLANSMIEYGYNMRSTVELREIFPEY